MVFSQFVRKKKNFWSFYQNIYFTVSCIFAGSLNKPGFEAVYIAFLWLPICTLGTILSNYGLNEVPVNIEVSETYLDLSRNNITQIKKGAFVGLKRLWYLRISHNNISTIVPGAFDGLVALEWLHLQHNRIRILPDISNLLSLVSFNIGWNPIESLHRNRIGNLTKLQYFLSKRCELRGVLVLPSLKSTHSITLGGNDIKALAEKLLNGFQNLRFVGLSNNQLASLPKLGDGSKHIEKLHLAGNRFYQIPNFLNFESLKMLDLSRNYISVLPKDFLPPTLTSLYLSMNPIECMAGHCWTTKHSWFNKSQMCRNGNKLDEIEAEVLCEGNIYRQIISNTQKDKKICINTYYDTVNIWRIQLLRTKYPQTNFWIRHNIPKAREVLTRSVMLGI